METENLDFLTTITQKAYEYAPLVVGAILVLIIGFWAVNGVVRMLDKQLKNSGMDEDLRPFLLTLANVLLKVLVFFSAAGIVGIETTSFVALLAAAGFAIGMALQGTLGHFAAGVLILFFKPYRTGDFIVAQGYSGTVKEIQIFNTILTTLDNRIIIVPNGAITSGPIENLTSPGQRVVDLTFGIGYGDDIDKARSVLEQVIKSTDMIIQEKENQIFVKELADSSVNFAVRVWVDVNDYWPVYFHMHEEVKKAFDREGVSIPFPQMDVHVDNNA